MVASAGMKECSFHLSHYEETLKGWIGAGYACVGFKDIVKHKEREKVLVLRHDLDFKKCIPNGLVMAGIESELGATATYFVRLHAEEYNPMEYNTYLVLKRITDMGHEVGLHFECHEFSEVTGESKARVFKKEKKLLETLLEREVVSACEHGDYHRFDSTGFKRFFERHKKEKYGIRFDPYEPAYFREMKYLSDSNQNWREGCFCGHVGRHWRIQVATHPGFWFERHYVLG